MDTLGKIFELMKGFFSFLLNLIQKDSEHQQAYIRNQKFNFENSNNNTINFNNNNSVISDKKKAIAVLEKWMSDLEEGVYKGRAEIVNLFCQYVIPTIRDNPDFACLVTSWRKDYEMRNRELDYLQEVVFMECRDAFESIVIQSGDSSEVVRCKIKDIEDLIAGDRSRIGYTTRPLYLELYYEIKDLIYLLLNEGRQDICSQFAILVTDNKYQNEVDKFTFASDIERIPHIEKLLHYNRRQDPIVVWKYFEIACYFWNIKNEDIERELKDLHEKNPFYAINTRSAWKEIADIKFQENGSDKPLIYQDAFFKTGLRTLINAITTHSQTNETNSLTSHKAVAAAIFFTGVIWAIWG